VPAAGVTLALRDCVSSGCSTLATSVANAQGQYRFVGVPSTPSGHWYYVRFSSATDATSAAARRVFDVNHLAKVRNLGSPNGLQLSTAQRLSNWYADAMDNYAAGTNRHGGDFDIADVSLVSPRNGTSQTFPITFNWGRRAAAFADLYQLEFFDASWKVVGMGDISDYTSSSDTLSALPAGMSLGKPYYWTVIVYGPDGYGMPYYARKVTFTTLANGEIGITTLGRVPVAQGIDLESLGLRNRH